MTYGVSTNSTGATYLNMIQDGFGLGMPRLYSYVSSHACTDVGGVSGFFKGAGATGKSSNNVGLTVGDLVIVQASTNPTGGIVGRAYIASITASTIDQATTSASSAYHFGFDCTCSLSS